MRIGTYDQEPETVKLIDDFIATAGYINDLSTTVSTTKSTSPTHEKPRQKN